MSDEKMKHLEFIQNIITRMNSNSFQIKGWTVTLVAALLALFTYTGKNFLLLVCLLPAAVFWFLDAWYLCQERRFRALYNDVAGTGDAPKEIKPFAMQTDLYKGGDCSYWKVFRSRSIAFMYLPLSILPFILFLYFQIHST